MINLIVTMYKNMTHIHYIFPRSVAMGIFKFVCKFISSFPNNFKQLYYTKVSYIGFIDRVKCKIIISFN